LFERWRPRDQAAAAQRFGGCRTRGRCCRASKRSRHRPASAGRGDGAAVAPADLGNLERLPAGSPRTRTIARAWPRSSTSRTASASRSTSSATGPARAGGGDREIQVSCLARGDLLRWRRQATRMPWKGYADGDDSSGTGDA
jgi:hypothetical protein